MKPPRRALRTPTRDTDGEVTLSTLSHGNLPHPAWLVHQTPDFGVSGVGQERKVQKTWLGQRQLDVIRK